jgi:hypothetical protein
MRYADSLEKINNDVELQNWAKELSTAKEDGGAGFRVNNVSVMISSILIKFLCVIYSKSKQLLKLLTAFVCDSRVSVLENHGLTFVCDSRVSVLENHSSTLVCDSRVSVLENHGLTLVCDSMLNDYGLPS